MVKQSKHYSQCRIDGTLSTFIAKRKIILAFVSLGIIDSEIFY